jgi:hypothetical protein
MDLDDAAVFDATSMSATNFANLAKRGLFWIDAGASLLRSSDALMRQAEADATRFTVGARTPPPRRSAVALQAIMLAAMALENALKSILAETGRITHDAKTGKLLFGCGGHDVKALAALVSITPTDKAEQHALEHGERFITSVGRYPLAITPDKQSRASGMSPPRLVEAYRRLFFRCAEKMARSQFPNWPDPPTKSPEEHIEFWRRQLQDWMSIP